MRALFFRTEKAALAAQDAIAAQMGLPTEGVEHGHGLHATREQGMTRYYGQAEYLPKMGMWVIRLDRAIRGIGEKIQPSVALTSEHFENEPALGKPIAVPVDEDEVVNVGGLVK